MVIVWREVNGLGQACQRLFLPPQQSLRQAPVAIGQGKPGAQRDSAVVFDHRLFQPPQILERVAGKKWGLGHSG